MLLNYFNISLCLLISFFELIFCYLFEYLRVVLQFLRLFVQNKSFKELNLLNRLQVIEFWRQFIQVKVMLYLNDI